MEEKNIVTNNNDQNETVTNDIEMKTQDLYQISLYEVKYHNNTEYYTPW